MRASKLKVLCSLIIFVALPAAASNLVLVVDHHGMRAVDETPLATVFTDESLLATVTLDVYVSPVYPSSNHNYDRLSKLNETNWAEALQWSLADLAGNRVVAVVPKLLSSTTRSRGPDAAAPGDRWTVCARTFQGRFEFDPLPAGEYVLRIDVHGLSSEFPLGVRTGEEPAIRDQYLELKASKATSYEEFRTLQFERRRLDPENLDPVFDLIPRALLEGSLDEMKELFATAIATMEKRRERGAKPGREFFVRRLQQLREAERVLPEYFARREEWSMIPTPRGGYIIQDRRSGAVVRTVGEESARNR